MTDLQEVGLLRNLAVTLMSAGPRIWCVAGQENVSLRGDARAAL